MLAFQVEDLADDQPKLRGVNVHEDALENVPTAVHLLEDVHHGVHLLAGFLCVLVLVLCAERLLLG